ncbi:MAG: co-chaperone DjlA [Gammaproteobacteria bacterium]|nr:co-chaperone DjlA [Gammaproteobacteria bacterium]
MSWWGKLFGGTFGMMFGGPLGALLGAALGHKFDKGLDFFKEMGGGQSRWSSPGEVERVQSAFFTATFAVMGAVAKADGHVSSHEIAMARQIMDQMQLNAEQREIAQKLFNEGKQPQFPLDDAVEQLRQECHRRRNLLRMFLEIQIHAAFADGTMEEREREILLHIATILGFSAKEFQLMERMVAAVYSFHQRQEGANRGRGKGVVSASELQAAYELIGVSSQASDDEVKRAYRQLMSRHHPDKLVSKGLPEEMMKMATIKTQEIKSAYDLIRQSRIKVAAGEG